MKSHGKKDAMQVKVIRYKNKCGNNLILFQSVKRGSQVSNTWRGMQLGFLKNNFDWCLDDGKYIKFWKND